MNTIKKSRHETAREKYAMPLLTSDEWSGIYNKWNRVSTKAKDVFKRAKDAGIGGVPNKSDLEMLAEASAGVQFLQSFRDLDIVTINRKSYTANPQFFGRVLTGVQEFIAENYKGDDVLSRPEFASELKDAKNKNYTIDAVVDRATKEIVAVVAHDVADVPKNITRQGLIPGDEQYTSIYYARSRGGGIYTTSKEHEPVLQMLIENAMNSGQQYSASRGKANVGFITIDSRHKRVLHELAQKYGGGYTPVEIGVPTLRDDVVGPNYPANFTELHKEKPVVIPNGKWTKPMLIRVMASDLDQSYNHLKPGEKGYIPLTTASYFKDFAAAVKALPGTHVDFKPIK